MVTQEWGAFYAADDELGMLHLIHRNSIHLTYVCSYIVINFRITRTHKPLN